MNITTSSSLSKKFIKTLDKYDITIFFFLVELSNSIVISFMVLNNNVPINKIWKAINLEEKFNEQKWGKDKEGYQKLLLKKNFFTDIIKFKDTFNKEENEK